MENCVVATLNVRRRLLLPEHFQRSQTLRVAVALLSDYPCYSNDTRASILVDQSYILIKGGRSAILILDPVLNVDPDSAAARTRHTSCEVVVSEGTFCLTSIKRLHLRALYAPNSRAERMAAYSSDFFDLRSIPSSDTTATLLGGDFNDYPSPLDRSPVDRLMTTSCPKSGTAQITDSC